MDLEKRIEDAIRRGKTRDTGSEPIDPDLWTPQRLKNRHNDIRLSISEYIEKVMGKIDDHLPGFKRETLFGDKGWGSAIYRDDFASVGGKRNDLYSRFEIYVRSMNDYHVVDLVTKATVRNKELWNRNIYKEIQETDEAALREKIDSWAVQFAENYSLKD